MLIQACGVLDTGVDGVLYLQLLWNWFRKSTSLKFVNPFPT